MVDLGYDVKSDAQIRQWQHRYKKRLPSPENCTGIELATNGQVTRPELRPSDWQQIWPELPEPVSGLPANDWFVVTNRRAGRKRRSGDDRRAVKEAPNA